MPHCELSATGDTDTELLSIYWFKYSRAGCNQVRVMMATLRYISTFDSNLYNWKHLIFCVPKHGVSQYPIGILILGFSNINCKIATLWVCWPLVANWYWIAANMCGSTKFSSFDSMRPEAAEASTASVVGSQKAVWRPLR